MNLIKHLANILFLLAIPYALVLFFELITGFAFTYHEAITAGPFVVLYTVYAVVIMIPIYIISLAEVKQSDREALQLFKTRKY